MRTCTKCIDPNTKKKKKKKKKQTQNKMKQCYSAEIIQDHIKIELNLCYMALHYDLPMLSRLSAF